MRLRSMLDIPMMDALASKGRKTVLHTKDFSSIYEEFSPSSPYQQFLSKKFNHHV